MFDSATLPAALSASVTVPLKALPLLLRLMPPADAVTVVLPMATLMLVLADCEMLPAAVIVSVPFVTATLPRVRALLLASVTLSAEALLRATAPLKALPVLAD